MMRICGIAVWNEPPKPVRDMEDIIAAFFLVHGSHDLVNPVHNGGVVPLPPIEEGINPCG